MNENFANLHFGGRVMNLHSRVKPAIKMVFIFSAITVLSITTTQKTAYEEVLAEKVEIFLTNNSGVTKGLSVKPIGMIFNDKFEYSLIVSSSHPDFAGKPVTGIEINVPTGIQGQQYGIVNHIGTVEPITDPKYKNTHIGYGRYRVDISGWGYVDVDFSDSDYPFSYPSYGLDRDIWLILQSDGNLYWNGAIDYLIPPNADLLKIWDQSRITNPPKSKPQNKNGFVIPNISEPAPYTNIPLDYEGALDKLYVKATVQGNVTVTNDISVESGATFTFNVPGTQVKFNSGKKLTVKGTLIAQGTSANPITFTRNGSSGTWGGIRYLSSGSSAGLLRNCTISNADIAVYIDRRSPQIETCFIDDADNYGIYVTGSSAWPYVDDNYIEADIACVAHYNSGNGNFVHNSFRNAQYGVYVSSGSPRYDYYNVGRNKFETSISQDRVKVLTGQPWVGMYQYFTKPSGGGYYKYIHNSGTSTINAVQNYWSEYPPSSSYFFGNVDRSNPLSSPPSNPPAGPTWSLPKGMGEDFLLAFNDASMLFWDGKYMEARESFKELTEQYLDAEYSSYALNWCMLSTEQLEAVGTQRQYLNSIKQDKSAHVSTCFYAQKWLLQCEMREGTREKAKELAAEVEPGSVYDREISFDLAMGLFDYQGDKQGTEEVLTDLLKKFKDDDTAEAVEFIRSHIATESAASNPITERHDKADEEFSVGVFPNPFNPETTIRYRVSGERMQEVSLVIFNTLGQRVRTLVEARKNPGDHLVVWNGRDNFGKEAASGMYFLRATIGGTALTHKLMLLR
ncbi:MAG: T9SS type A sorting domain-containing protein [Anaerolineae bacterium]|nr:T9SS type A sorting domain-containing protein [Anaerolineae bacterium]